MIEARGLTRRFGDVTAVSQLSLQVPDGSILALLGPNGAGKTTTVRMLAGLIAPSEGEATVAGYSIRQQAAKVRASVGLVTDTPGLYEQMAVNAYLDLFGSIYGVPAAERSSRINELLELFELAEHRNQRMAGFSKGMKQKVALARTLVHQPSVLFLDEPTSGLDPLAARAVRELIMGLKHSSRSIILCTHDLDEAERLADRVAIMRQGRIVACDTPIALRAQATGETRVRVEFADTGRLSLESLYEFPGMNAPVFKQEQEPILEYHTAQPKVVNPQVLSELFRAGAQIVSVTCETRTLEDVYASAMDFDRKQQLMETSFLDVAELTSSVL